MTGTVTKASANWIVPTATCNSSYSLALFWVGIDGYNTGTVEQTGTYDQCYEGSAYYGAWWELYPLNDIQTLGGMTISPGDHMTGTVTYSTSSHKFSMTIIDHATGQQFEVIGTQSGTTESTAECIAEAASTSGRGYDLLANFGKVHFTSCTATIAGRVGRDRLLRDRRRDQDGELCHGDEEPRYSGPTKRRQDLRRDLARGVIDRSIRPRRASSRGPVRSPTLARFWPVPDTG